MVVGQEFISVKFSESQLRERNKVLSLLLDMSNFLSSAESLQDMLTGALAKVMESFDFDAGRIYLMDEGGESLTLAAFQGTVAEGFEKVKITEGFSGKAARTRSFIAQSVSELDDEKRARFLISRGFRIIVCVPLIVMGEVLGVMNLATAKTVELDQNAIDLLISLGNQIAVAANNIRLHESLRKKICELKLQKKAIEFFAYSISHDLKSPAVAIYGLTKRLHKLFCEPLEPPGNQYCDQILKAAEQVVVLVDRINAYITAKEAPIRFERLDMREITEDIRSEFTETMAKRGIEWHEPQRLPVAVCDRLSLTRVFRNLVDNALKYGGKDLSCVEIGYIEHKESHTFFVRDDGVGLRVDDPETLFEIFRRGGTSKGVEGTGLGLATVREIAERHGGRVWLESSNGGGSTFYFSISRHLEAA